MKSSWFRPPPTSRTLGQLVEKLKADTGAVAWGGGSAGGTDHILAGLIAQAAGADATKLNYVPFSGGGEALAAIMGGHVTAGISGIGEWLGQIQAGELRALAISAPERVEGLDIPTLKEQGVDVDLANWRAVVARSRHRRCAEEGAGRRGRRHGTRARAGRRCWPTRAGWTSICPATSSPKYLAEENERVTRDPEDPGPGLVGSMLDGTGGRRPRSSWASASPPSVPSSSTRARPSASSRSTPRSGPRTFRSWSAPSWRCSASRSPGKAGARSRRRASIRRP